MRVSSRYSGDPAIIYLWSTVARDTPLPHGNLGVSDNKDRARIAAENCLRNGQARLAFIEAAQTVTAASSLSPCYLRIGAAWWATPGPSGEVRWNRFTGDSENWGQVASAQLTKDTPR
ncbi:MAG TPA: hypothetical protein VN969_22815 [Streptosporangiaceae bacterium]|nr:hypothetical protein [Streptosporangiaceae bacterium]